MFPILIFLSFCLLVFLGSMFFMAFSSALFFVILIFLLGFAVWRLVLFLTDIDISTTSFWVGNTLYKTINIDDDNDSVSDISDNDSVISDIDFPQQVFNIPGNSYDYSNAKALCKAYGSRLATYAEIERTYNEGGEWCNYGWSEGQMAFFPTQPETYDKLQRIKGHENDCGRPGVNGGYFANPYLQFGVNCYGSKPKITDIEKTMMEQDLNPYPSNPEDIAMNQQVDYWKSQLQNIIVSPFNYDRWSSFF